MANRQPSDDAREFMARLLGDDAGPERFPVIAVLGVGDRNWADTYQAQPS